MCFGVDSVFCILPILHPHVNIIVFSDASHLDIFVVQCHHMSDFPVVVFPFDVVLDEHHLRPHFQSEVKGGRVGIFGECAFYLGDVCERLRVEALHLVVVIFVCHAVVGSQSDISVLGIGHEGGVVSLVQGGDVFCRGMSFTDMVEKVNEGGVGLSVYFL